MVRSLIGHFLILYNPPAQAAHATTKELLAAENRVLRERVAGSKAKDSKALAAAVEAARVTAARQAQVGVIADRE
jgi:hypothetical protein